MILWWVRILNEFEVSGKCDMLYCMNAIHNVVLQVIGETFHVISCFFGEQLLSSSLERIQGYIDIEHEPKSTPEGVPPAYWPSSGKIVVDKLSARYSKVWFPLTFVPRLSKIILTVGWTNGAEGYFFRNKIRRTCWSW